MNEGLVRKLREALKCFHGGASDVACRVASEFKPGLPRRENLPITHANVREWFPSPRMENALAGEPWWQVQSLGLLAALRILELVPPGPEQQQALVEIRRALDTALLAV